MDSNDRPLSTGPAPDADPPEPPTDTPKPRMFTARSILFVALSGLLVFLGLTFFPQLTGAGRAPEPLTALPTSTATFPAAPAPAPTPSELPTAAVPAGPAASPPQRLVYPAADIDVAIHPLAPTGADQASQTIVPPPTMDGYWLTPYGVPGAGSRNTTYVAGHSWVDRDAPFNRLSTKAAVGDRFTVTTATGTLAYRVDSVTTYKKSGLKNSPIWRVAPNRLVLISCYTGDFWGTNVVVVASPVGP